MGIITIAFDDGYRDTFDNCAAFLAENGIKATFAVPSACTGKTLENRRVITTEDLAHLAENGHEIAAHTVNHLNLLDIFYSEGEPAVRAEMAGSKEELEKMTGTEIPSMVFPFIEMNNSPILRGMASEYYASSRITTEDPVFNKLPVDDPFSITGIALTTGTILERHNELVDAIKDTDLWLIEVFHLVSEKNTLSAHINEPYRFFTHTDIFKEHIHYILSRDITIMTQGEVIRKHHA